MNQPTEDRIKRLEEEQKNLREEVRQLREQMTEPIRIDRLEIDRGGTHKRLDAVQENTAVLKDDVGVLKIQMEGARADILRIRESQADLRDRLVEHSEDLKEIKTKQDTHSEVLEQLITIGERSENTQAEHTKRFDKLEKLMMQMLDRLPGPEGE